MPYARDDDAIPNRWPLGEMVQLHLTLDTTARVKSAQILYDGARTDTVRHWFAAYPVLVRNETRDTIRVGRGDDIPLELEALDPRGKWQVIEAPHSVFCSVGMAVIVLPPQQVVLTSVNIPHGSFHTQLRIRKGLNHSLPFQGYVNPLQFERTLAFYRYYR